MDLDNAFFDEIICENYSSSDSENEEFEHTDDKENKNKNKITVSQRNKLFSAMDDRADYIPKGKLKSDDKTAQLLAEWQTLTLELNSLGPPSHSSLEWRRIWTKMKYNKKRKSGTAVLCSRNDNKKVKCHTPVSKQPECEVSPVEPFTPAEQIQNKTFEKLSSIAMAIVSLGEQQAAAFESMDKKLNVLVAKQEIMNEKLNLLTEAVNVNTRSKTQ